VSDPALARFRIDSSTGRVVFEMPPGKNPLEMGWGGGLLGSRKNIEHLFESFRRRAGGLHPPLDTLRNAIAELGKDAYQLALVLAGDSDKALREIRNRLWASWPYWRNPGDTVPVVEIVGRHHQFPFELLPLFDHTPVRETFVNYDEAERELTRFLGWSTVVHRTPSASIDTTPLERAKQLPLQYLRYLTDGASEEEHYFESLDRLEVEQPWPRQEGEVDEARERVIDVLNDPRLTMEKTVRPGLPIQIRHFACHADTSSPDPQGWFLLLGGPDRKDEIQVTLRDITDGWRSRELFDGPRPLMFMNACATSRLDPDTERSFPNWALQTRHRGFIGTETKVPDEVASAFAEMLYETMLAGKPIGQAINIARRRLMRLKQSPLGLLYLHYGSPSVRIERHV
jgi:hypothetical protein